MDYLSKLSLFNDVSFFLSHAKQLSPWRELGEIGRRIKQPAVSERITIEGVITSQKGEVIVRLQCSWRAV